MLAASAPTCKPPRATFAAFLRSSEPRHALGHALQGVGDARRPGPRRVPMGAVLTAAVAGFAGGLGAVRSWEDALRHRAPYRHLLRATGHTGTISDDTFGLAFEAASLEDLRAVLRSQAKRELNRWSTGPHANSRLGHELIKLDARRLAAWPVLAIDGHTLFSCQEQKCEACIRIPNGTVERWYHKVVVAQWVGTHPAMVVDFEPIGPSNGASKDSETAAAKRLLARVAATLPDTFRVLLLDALYDSEPMRAAIAAVATLVMERWSQENTGFHELAGQLNLDRAHVHKGRANAAWTVVAVALIAYNAWQAYLYRVLKLDPMRPGRTWGDLRRDMWSSLGEREAPLALPTTGPP
ncbi:MAG: hypothetical protein VKQ33_11990 [Candidatus Sericytochromatia bacterium]|nr:hypothetical protein [Candidatus Sericytochromatia bacterium]